MDMNRGMGMNQENLGNNSFIQGGASNNCKNWEGDVVSTRFLFIEGGSLSLNW